MLWVAALSLFAGGAGVAAAEWGCRLWGFPPDLSEHSVRYKRFLSENGGRFFDRRHGPAGPELVQAPEVWKEDRGQRFPLRKRPDVTRVVVVGESTADQVGFMLRRLAASDRRYEVMNLGTGAGSIEMVERRLREALALEPDAILLAFGHNLCYHHPRWLGLLLRRAPFLAESHLASTLSRLLNRNAREAPRPAQRIARFDRFLEDASARTRSLGIPMIALVLPSNHWFAPDSTPEERADPEFLEAGFLYESGQRLEALARLEALLALKPRALWHFRAADWRYRLGDKARAYRHLVAARDLDPAANRASSATNSLLRAASARAGFHILDLQQELEGRRPDGLVGWETYMENQHARRSLLESWGLRIFALLADVGLAQGELHPIGERDRPEVRLESALGMIDLKHPSIRTSLSYAARDWLNESVSEPPWLKAPLLHVRRPLDSRERATILLLLAEGYWMSGRRSRAWTLNREAAREDPAWGEPLAQRGVFLLREGRKHEGAAALGRALALGASEPFAKHFLKRLGGGAPAWSCMTDGTWRLSRAIRPDDRAAKGYNGRLEP